MKECEVLGYDFDEWRYYAELLKRDPEGPGIMLQPVLLRYGYPWPELAEL